MMSCAGSLVGCSSSQSHLHVVAPSRDMCQIARAARYNLTGCSEVSRGPAAFSTSSRRRSPTQLAAIKGIDSFDGKFELAAESEEALVQLLGTETFRKQASRGARPCRPPCHPVRSAAAGA